MRCLRSGIPPFSSSTVFSGVHRLRRGVAGHRSSLCGFEDSGGYLSLRWESEWLPIVRIDHIVGFRLAHTELLAVTP